MSLLAAERTKLLSTRSPWWCTLLLVVLGVGIAVAVGFADSDSNPVSVGVALVGLSLGSYVVMVLAVIATTSEFTTGTIRTTFTASPRRWPPLLAKAVVVASAAALVGLVVAFAAWAAASTVASADLALDTSADWRAVAGQGLLYAGYAVIAVGVGLLLRSTAGAIAVLLVWALVVETVVVPIVDVVADLSIGRWLPFANAGIFVSSGDAVTDPGTSSPFGGPWGSLAYFLAVAGVLLALGVARTVRRDA